MLIFGYGPRPPKDHGPAAPIKCLRCGNQTYYHYVTQKTAFSLFFVPVLPTRTVDQLVCPICRFGIDLTRSQAAHAMDMIRATTRYERAELSHIEYMSMVDKFWLAIIGQAPSDNGPAATAPHEGNNRGRQANGTDTEASPPDPATRQPDPPPGWYPDPFEEAEARYWDGTRWTRGTKPPT
ncbi:MAG: DUF2510 domain-containing protein [Acidimicrobiales bacterium]|nr:DUF2510 domain-containing protein [Acidimicrobiales bacterium]